MKMRGVPFIFMEGCPPSETEVHKQKFKMVGISKKTTRNRRQEIPAWLKINLFFFKFEIPIYLKDVNYWFSKMAKKLKLTEKEKFKLKAFWIGVGVYIFLIAFFGSLLALYVAKFGFGWF